MNDLGVVEASDDLEDTVDGSDVRQKVVSESSSGGGTYRDRSRWSEGVLREVEIKYETRGDPRRTLGETGDVDTGKESGHDRLGLVEGGEPVESLVGNGDSG